MSTAAIPGKLNADCILGADESVQDCRGPNIVADDSKPIPGTRKTRELRVKADARRSTNALDGSDKQAYFESLRRYPFSQKIPSYFKPKERYPKRTFATKPKGGWTYETYIRSEEWRDKRREVFEERGRICEECGHPHYRLEVHHLTYVRLGCERNEDLQILCPPCHDKIHGRLKSERAADSTTILPHKANKRRLSAVALAGFPQVEEGRHPGTRSSYVNAQAEPIREAAKKE